jgi:pimeloyl-ACP methyl ester carboxylesterase
MKKVFIALFLLLVVFYMFPVKKFTFKEIYIKQDSLSLSLENFRKEQTRSALVDGNSFKYHFSGKGDTTILFLHGMGGSYDIWWQQIIFFRPNYKTLSLTYPNVNTLQQLSAGLNKILEQEKISKVIVVGSSLGGYLAQYFTIQYPEKVIKTSLGNTFAPNQENKAKNETLVKIMQYLPEWLVIKTIRAKYNKEVIPSANNHPTVNAFLNELLGSEVTKEAFTNRYYCVVDTFSSKINSNIPIQIIESSNDPLVSKKLREALKAQYPQAKKVNLGNIGHFGYLNEPGKYNEAIEEFIN